MKLTWKTTGWAMLAGPVLWASGCGGAGEVDGSGGEGGSGGSGTGGSMVVPDSCTDDEQNGSETDVDCGGSECTPCADGSSCEAPADCASGVCTDGACAEPECGDGVTNGEEECDSDGEDSETCNADCTEASCGDGHVNEEAGEVCERPEDAGVWARCNDECSYGALLDGTWDEGMGGASGWQELDVNEPAGDEYIAGLQSFHYAGTPYLYDLTTNTRYDIEDDEWTALEEDLPYVVEYWENGAVDAESIWVPRGGAMHRFVLETETWEIATEEVPDGTDEATAAIFDGEGFIWYAGGDDDLVRYNPEDGEFDNFSYAANFAGFDVYETRMAYDPFTNVIVFTGYSNDNFLIFDLEEETFAEGSVNPGGAVKDNSCQDRAGGIYVGSNDYTTMYRYDIAADEYTALPELPVLHDNNASCVVSEDGYLYFATSEVTNGQFFRLPLNKR